jgi:hypothetical protein
MADETANEAQEDTYAIWQDTDYGDSQGRKVTLRAHLAAPKDTPAEIFIGYGIAKNKEGTPVGKFQFTIEAETVEEAFKKYEEAREMGFEEIKPDMDKALKDQQQKQRQDALSELIQGGASNAEAMKIIAAAEKAQQEQGASPILQP